MQKERKQEFLIVIALFLFPLGFILGNQSSRIDPAKEAAQIVSCNGYEEEFLKEAGFNSRSNCSEAYLALHEQYSKECSENIKLSGNESQDKKMLNLCVYHLLEKDEIYLTSEYAKYKHEK